MWDTGKLDPKEGTTLLSYYFFYVKESKSCGKDTFSKRF